MSLALKPNSVVGGVIISRLMEGTGIREGRLIAAPGMFK